MSVLFGKSIMSSQQSVVDFYILKIICNQLYPTYADTLWTVLIQTQLNPSTCYGVYAPPQNFPPGMETALQVPAWDRRMETLRGSNPHAMMVFL